MSTWRLDLPWPAPPLRENDRMHWAQKARLTAQLREGAWLIARSQRLPRGLGRVRIVLHWQPGVRRRRDQLGASPTLKALVDGLTDYGLTVDDDIDHVEVWCVIEPVQKPARLWLEITDLSEQQEAS